MSTISVLILSYNRPRYLAEMLEAVLRQTRSPMEILILDNGSDPEVKREIEPMLANPLVRWEGLSQNIGPIANFGRAFGLARGDYVTVLHDDDLIRDDFLEILGGYLDREPSIGTVTCRGQLIRGDGSTVAGASLIGPDLNEKVRIFRKAGDVALEYARDRCLIFGATVYRRLIAGLIPHRPEFGKVIDVIYFCELADAAGVACLADAPYFVRSHGNQDSASFPVESMEKLDRYFFLASCSTEAGSKELRWRLRRRMTYRAFDSHLGGSSLLARSREPGFAWGFLPRYWVSRLKGEDLMSTKSRGLSAVALWGIALLAVTASAIQIVAVSHELPYFIDEVLNVQSAYNLMILGNYSPGDASLRFPAGITTGIFGTWPSGAVFLFGGGLGAARSFTGILLALEAVFLLTAFFRRQGLELRRAIPWATITWGLSMKIPYWFGYLHTLGELAGALWLLAGVLLLDRRPHWAALCIGISVWACKFIYLPCAGVLGAAYFFGRGEKPWTHPKKHLEMAAIFFAPVALWAAVIMLRFDSQTVIAWIKDFMGFVQGSNAGSQSPVPAFHLFERLRAPELEWVRYRIQDQVKILFFTFGAAAIATMIACLLRRNTSRLIHWMHGAVLAVIGFYTAWYFLWHPAMYIRHLLPAMYLGFGLLVFQVSTYVLKHRPAKALQLGALLFSLVVFSLQLKSALPGFLNRGQNAYVRNCKDLFSHECKPQQ